MDADGDEQRGTAQSEAQTSAQGASDVSGPANVSVDESEAGAARPADDRAVNKSGEHTNDPWTVGDPIADTKAPKGPIETRWQRRQFEATLVGATTSTGAVSVPDSLARHTMASACSVLPRPMSSASTPPSPASQSTDSHW